MTRSLVSLFSLAFGLLGGISGYLSAAYWPAENERTILGATVVTPLAVAFMCGFVPYWCVHFAGDLLINA